MKQLVWPSHPFSSLHWQLPVRETTVKQQAIFELRTLGAVIRKSRYVFAGLLTIVVFLSPPLTSLVQSPVANAIQTTNPTGIITRSDAEIYYVNAVNSLRTSHGLAPLIIDARLTTSATQKGNDMVLQKYWAHFAPNGTSFSDYIWGASPRADRVGENLARCFDSRQEAFDALVASPTHYAIMTGQFTNFGVSEVEDSASGCTYTTMHFAQYAQ